MSVRIGSSTTCDALTPPDGSKRAIIAIMGEADGGSAAFAALDTLTS